MTDQRNLAELMAISPVIPVLTIDDAAHAAPLARALLEGGIAIVEITLRTSAAFAAITAMAQIPGMTVGAGTILTAAHYQSATDAGAQFIVSPGASPSILEAATRSKIPLLPGAATPTEILTLLECGYHHQKFFPAEPAGGIPMLKAIAAPIPDVKFCPTGGISPTNAAAYLALPNVLCIGGSWLTPADALRSGDWTLITQLAAAARGL